MLDRLKNLSSTDLMSELKGINFGYEFYTSTDFIKFVLSFNDPVKFRMILFALEDKVDVTIYE